MAVGEGSTVAVSAAVGSGVAVKVPVGTRVGIFVGAGVAVGNNGVGVGRPVASQPDRRVRSRVGNRSRRSARRMCA